MKPYYQEDGITLYCGDCREILPKLGVAELVISDPPYPNGEGYFDNSVEVAREVMQIFEGELMIFGSEITRPISRLPLVAVHIWHRNNVNGKIYEPIYHFHPDGQKRRSDLFSSPAVFRGAGAGCIEFAGHPTQKHTSVMRWLLQKTDGEVLDPFCGSGTTLVAAKQLGRKAIGVEIEEKYCEIAVKRLAQMELPFK